MQADKLIARYARLAQSPANVTQWHVAYFRLACAAMIQGEYDARIGGPMPKRSATVLRRLCKHNPAFSSIVDSLRTIGAVLRQKAQ